MPPPLRKKAPKGFGSCVCDYRLAEERPLVVHRAEVLLAVHQVVALLAGPTYI